METGISRSAKTSQTMSSRNEKRVDASRSARSCASPVETAVEGFAVVCARGSARYLLTAAFAEPWIAAELDLFGNYFQLDACQRPRCAVISAGNLCYDFAGAGWGLFLRYGFV